MKYPAFLALSMLFLAGCGAPALESIDLEPLLIQSGDLPAGVSGA